MLENPASSLLTKVVDEGVLHSVDSREFRRLIAPGSGSSGSSLPCSVVAAIADARPRWGNVDEAM